MKIFDHLVFAIMFMVAMIGIILSAYLIMVTAGPIPTLIIYGTLAIFVTSIGMSLE